MLAEIKFYIKLNTKKSQTENKILKLIKHKITKTLTIKRLK